MVRMLKLITAGASGDGRPKSWLVRLAHAGSNQRVPAISSSKRIHL